MRWANSRVEGVALGLALVAVIHGYFFCNFVPSEAWRLIGAVLAIALGLFFMFWVMQHRSDSAPPLNVFQVIFVWVFGGAMFSYGAWFAVGKSIPTVATAMIGIPHAEEAMLSKSTGSVAGRHRSPCAFGLTGGRIQESPTGEICVTERQYHDFPPGKVRVLLTGKESAFGFLVVGFQLVEPPKSENAATTK